MLTIADWNFITPFYINTMYNFPSFIRNWFSDSEYFYYNGRIRRNSFWYLEKLWGPGFYFMIFCDILVTFSCHKYRIKVTQLCNHRCLLLKNTTFCRCFTHVTDLFLSRYGQNGLLWYHSRFPIRKKTKKRLCLIGNLRNWIFQTIFLA